MSGLSWWRSWHGAPMDTKWPVIAARSGVKVGVVSAIAWALLDYASQHHERGTVTGFDTEVYAIYSGFPENEIIAVIQAMIDKGIIANGRLANWEKRQPKREDDSRDRVTRHRELKRSVTQSNAPDTDTDTDTDKDKEYDIQADFSSLQVAFENKTGYPVNPDRDNVEAINAWIKDGILPVDIEDAVAYYSGNGKVARSPKQIDKSVRTAHGIRVQANSKSTNSQPSKAPVASEVFE